MKPLFLRIAITSCLFIFSNYLFAFSHLTNSSGISIEQEDQNDWEKEQAKNNPKRNDEAVEALNKIIKNLEVDKEHDKAEALKAMRDYIKKNRKEDTGTTLHKARKEAKKTATGKNKEKTIKEYIDKIGSSISKKVFKLLLSTRGTGQTTGHIITLSITNNGNYNISLIPELVYVPSNGRYQSYIAYIPDLVTIAPGTTINIPIPGYCANPHVPPVPNNESMPSPEEWIPVNIIPSDGFTLIGDPPAAPEPMNPPQGSKRPPQRTVSVYVSDQPTIPSFDPGMIGMIEASPGFNNDETDPDTEIQITWPGTLEEVGGTIDPEINPEIFATVAVQGLIEIIDKVDTIQKSGMYTTPFSNDKEKEKEAITQQTFWIFTAGLVGDEYKEEDFANNVYQQFESATGKSVTALPPEQKEQIDNGVNDFWTTYTAVGLEAKIISVETPPTVPISNPENEAPAIEKEKDCCDSTRLYSCDPPLDFDMKIADQWTNPADRRKIIQEAKKAMGQGIDPKVEQVFGEYNISKNPTSSTSFWKPGVVGGFTSAHAKTWFKKDGKWEWVWGTNKLSTQAEGKMSRSLKYETGDTCRAIVAGTSLIRIKASSSAFDAVAGNRHNENSKDQLAFLSSVKYGAKTALEWLILRGRGKTKKPFNDYVKDDLTDKVKGEISSQVEAEAQNLANEHLEEYLKNLGLTAEDLSMDKLKIPDLEESLENLLGIDIPNLGDLEDFISDGIEASLNLFFVANTKATANGFLIVTVGSNQGKVIAHTSVHYGREDLEDTEEAMTWSGPDCQENIISDVQPNALTITTNGHVDMFSEALSEYGFGNGSAKAYLESMNLQMLVGLCIYQEGDITKFNLDVDGSLQWFGGSSSAHQENLKTALKHLENDLEYELSNEINDFQQTKGRNFRETNEYTTLEKYTGEMLKNSLEKKIRKWAAENPFYWKDCSN